MIEKAEPKPFAELIAPETNRNIQYVIPNYQREYSWGKLQCEELFKDICDAENGYYLGTVIWVKGENEIIDGQQRLTTISLLLSAIYSKIPRMDDEDLLFKKMSLKKLLVNEDNQPILKPQDQNSNRDDYNYLLNSLGIVKGINCIVPSHFGNRKIASNYRLFNTLIEDYSTKELFALSDKIRQVIFVSIEVADYQSAFLLFESMNNRGLSLSPLDLIKSKFISSGGDINEWQKLIEYLGDEGSEQEQFLRNNYNAFRAEYNSIDFSKQNKNTEIKYEISNKAVKGNLINIYSSLMMKDINKFIEDLVARAKLYSIMLGTSNEVKDNNPQATKFADFRHAKATSAFLIVLYLYNYQSQFELSSDEFSNILDYILKFFVRRNLTNNPGTGAIPQILMEIITEINKLPVKNYNQVKNIIERILKAKASSDSMLREVVSGDIYLANPEMTKFLLSEINKKHQEESKEHKIDLWEYDNNKPIWTIEHIFPEGDNIPQCWIDMIAGGDENLAKKYLIDYTHKIGNLTLTGYNSKLSNFSFEKKKNRKSEKDKNIGYNNGLYLNESVYRQNEWTKEKIEERGKTMIDEIMEWLNIGLS